MTTGLTRIIILATLAGALCFLQAAAQQMSSDNPYYNFANYMLEKTLSTLVPCVEDLDSNITADWLCGIASVDEDEFQDLWDTYINVRPSGTALSSISTWGNIVLVDNSSIKGKIYRTDNGYIIVSYDPSSSEETAEGNVKIGYTAELDYVELPFYIPPRQAVAATSTKPEGEGASVETDEEDSDGEDTETPADEDGGSLDDEDTKAPVNDDIE